MTNEREEQRIIGLLKQLPEKEFALYNLGMSLRLALMEADTRRSPADLAFVAELVSRLDAAVGESTRAELRRWFAPGGTVPLWRRD